MTRRLIIGWILTVLGISAHAIERQVFIENADIDDAPSSSISFGGPGISDVEIETEEDDDGVIVTITYTDSDGDVSGILGLPAALGPVTRFNLPNSTSSYRVNPTTGQSGPDRPRSSSPEVTPSFQIGLNYAPLNYETAEVRGPGVVVFPDEGDPLNVTEDEFDVDNYMLTASFPVFGRYSLSLNYLDFEGDDTEHSRAEAGGGIDVGWLRPFDQGGTGLIAGDVGWDSAIRTDFEGTKFGASISWPCDWGSGPWQINPIVGVGYIDRELDYDTVLQFPGLADVSVTQAVEVEEEIWDLYAGANFIYPFNDNVALRLTGAVIYQDYEADAEVIQTEDLFGSLTVIEDSASEDDSSVGLMAGLGVVFSVTPNLALDLGYTYMSNSTYAEVENTTNGTAILEGERFDVGSDSGSVNGFTLGLTATF